MYFCYQGIRIFYERKEGEGLPVLLLHGWGCSIETLRPVFNYYASLGREVVAVDFPPFGKSEEPPGDFTVHSYAALVTALLGEIGITEFDVFCHSFGARVAALICQNAGVRTLVITGGAGLKPRFSLSKFIRIRAYKIRKRLGVKSKKQYGSDDYKSLSGAMKRVFVSVVNTHLDEEFSRIAAPTLLLWGEDDNQTPTYMARRMCRLIKGSRLVTLKGCGHFAFLDDTRAFLCELSRFYGGEK